MQRLNRIARNARQKYILLLRLRPLGRELLHVVVERGETVLETLSRAISKMNSEIEKDFGKIKAFRVEMSSEEAGSSVIISSLVEGEENAKKAILYSYEEDVDIDRATKKAISKLNREVKEVDGEIVDFKIETIPMSGFYPKSVVIIIAAVNSKTKMEMDRRERIARAIELLGDPQVINVSKLAEVFGVTRNTIYNDLASLGYKRVK